MRFLLSISLLSSFCLLSNSLPFSCPPRCQCYEDVEERSNSLHLICKWDQLNSTNLQSLSRPDLVRTLTIRCPHFAKAESTPPAGIFHGLRNLDRLEIDRCILTSLPGALFAGLHQLYSLIIKNARLPDIPKDLFSHTPNLMTLDMTGNQLRIEPFALRALSNLIHLDLSNNSINFLANTLISMNKLKVLTMDHNRLSNIDFRRLPEELSDLSLRHNSINTIHYVPNSARYLRRIDLAGNLLEFLSSSGSVNVLPDGLRSADLSNNRIAYIQEGTVAHMPKLAVLDLKNNSLSDLRENSVSGTPSSPSRLRLFLSHNPFHCHCNLKWIIHPTHKQSPIISDMDDIRCTHITDPSLSMSLSAADSRNMLMCKYTNICPETCTCCEDTGTCECRTNCPKGCQCYRSVNMEKNRTAHNTVMCDSLRLDKLEELPLSLTELRLSGVEWKDWDEGKLMLSRLKSLTINNSPMTEEEADSLADIPSLIEADLSSNRISTIPARLSRLSRLRLEQNPLSDLTPRDIAVLDTIKRVSIGGNISNFLCDCETPSPLQRWLREEVNRQKVDDLKDVQCDLNSFGKVPILFTLPGNGSLCPDETLDTTKWIEFVQNAQGKGTAMKTTEEPESEDDLKTLSSDVFDDSEWRMDREQVEKEKEEENTEKGETTETQTVSTTASTTKKKSTTPRPVFTTTWHRKRYKKEEPEENVFINVLIVLLLICLVVLSIAIGSTLYYRFVQAEEESQIEKGNPEQARLNEE